MYVGDGWWGYVVSVVNSVCVCMKVVDACVCVMTDGGMCQCGDWGVCLCVKLVVSMVTGGYAHDMECEWCHW